MTHADSPLTGHRTMSQIVLRLPTATHFRIRALEWVMAGMLVTCALVLAQPADTFANPAFADLARIAPEPVWTAILAFVGLARLFALYRNGAWVPSPWIRLFTALASAAIWTQFVLGFATVPTVPFGIGIFPWFVFADLYSVGRAADDARLSREARLAKPEAPVIVPPAA